QAARFVLEDYGIAATVILAHRRGNCAAYNAGFHTALNTYQEASHILVIDDDEIARPHWMETITAIARDTGASFTGAPQFPVFEQEEKQVWANHPVFRPPYDRSGLVPIIYSSGNVLIETSFLRKHGYPWLDERFNFLGGGDSDFYARCKAEGAIFAWATEAALDETTPSRRTELSWLNSRSLRNGSISALIQKRAARGSGDHLKRWVKSLLLLAASPYRSLTLFVNSRSLTMAVDPMNVALGRLLMEFGFANEQYRAADKN
ncbi:MAG: glycosyltransferase family 2 protein, partial [Rhizobiaceae bacterium]